MPALKRIVRLATTAFFLSSSAFVSATEINFQEFAFANNAIVKNQCAPYGVKFDGFYFSDDPLISIDGAGIAAFSGTPSSPLPNPLRIAYSSFPLRAELSPMHCTACKPFSLYLRISSIDFKQLTESFDAKIPRVSIYSVRSRDNRSPVGSAHLRQWRVTAPRRSIARCV